MLLNQKIGWHKQPVSQSKDRHCGSKSGQIVANLGIHNLPFIYLTI
jgi:hypothetical protein